MRFLVTNLLRDNAHICIGNFLESCFPRNAQREKPHCRTELAVARHCDCNELLRGSVQNRVITVSNETVSQTNCQLIGLMN